MATMTGAHAAAVPPTKTINRAVHGSPSSRGPYPISQRCVVHHSNFGALCRLGVKDGRLATLPAAPSGVGPEHPSKRTLRSATVRAPWCRFCCKSLFALAIKNSFGRRRDFRVKMWGTSSPEDKLTGDLRNVIEATSIGGRRSDFFTARKLAPSNLGLLQQYRPGAAVSRCRKILEDIDRVNLKLAVSKMSSEEPQ